MWSDHGREKELERLLGSGWLSGGPHDDWDLEQGATRVLIACERHDLGKARLLYRIWGRPADVPGLEDATPI